MSHLNEKGPENKGSKTGRKLGKCIKKPEENSSEYSLGQGMGKRRHAGINQKINKH